jgi:hypothetical protein
MTSASRLFVERACYYDIVMSYTGTWLILDVDKVYSSRLPVTKYSVVGVNFVCHRSRPYAMITLFFDKL